MGSRKSAHQWNRNTRRRNITTKTYTSNIKSPWTTKPRDSINHITKRQIFCPSFLPATGNEDPSFPNLE